jgi:hypothetical protein
VAYRGDVDRLITIGTPHLGAAIASKAGDLLGTRATSLKHNAPLIRRLNSDLDLPGGVRFASIVVRGFGADVRGKGKAYRDVIDNRFVEKLPIDYREGGDQVVHVLSQNLRLAPCAARYEKKTGRPVQYTVVRVNDASRLPAGRRVHGAAAFDPKVQELVAAFLDEKTTLWQPRKPNERSEWIDRQARLHAIGAVEAETLHKYATYEVRKVDLTRFTLAKEKENTRTYTLNGEAKAASRVIPLRRRTVRVRGTLEIKFDPFGRVVDAKTTVGRQDRK